jgi:glycosyltransferase involved in cell wall biosynthesis
MNPSYGGPPQGIRSSIQAMLALGIESEVVCCDRAFEPWARLDSFPIHAVGPGRLGFSYTRQLVPWLKKNANRFDAVILHGMWQWPGLAVLRARVPRFFLMPHGMLDPWFQTDSNRRLKALRNFFYWWLVERSVVNSADGLLFTCEEELRLARQTFGGYRPRCEINVGYGIPEPPAFTQNMQAAFVNKCSDVSGKPYILFLGRIHPKKGADILVEAYKKFLEVKPTNLPDLVIAGPGWDSTFGKRIATLIEGIAKIHSVGMLEGDAKWGALHLCEAFILPSHQENFGIAVVEALACNKPVLISNQVNIWREISKDNAGLVDEDSILGTLRLLQRFAKGELPANAGDRFRECFRRHFEIQQASRNLVKALEAA